MRNIFSLYNLLIVILVACFSCQKESFYEGKDATLKFSSDTVSFDTVFSSMGTVTKRLMIYNPYNQKINISAINLMGSNSPFILNINGKNSNSRTDVELSPLDSLYIFIQVFVNPTGQDSPLVLSDSLSFSINGNTQLIHLLAYGQDVHLIKNQHLKTQVWNSAKPYLLFGDVIVDSLETLTIEKGTFLYFHKNANLIVNGTLKVTGEFDRPVYFQGDRLDNDYKAIPGQWGGVQLSSANTQHSIHWLVMNNGTSGLTLGKPVSTTLYDLEITNSIIKNMAYSCFVAYHAKVKAVNCLFANAAVYTCGLISGGNYEFYHCSLANYYGLYDNRSLSIPGLYVSNYRYDPAIPSKKISTDLTSANFYNCLVYGTSTDELQLDSVSTSLFHYQFINCLLRSKTYNLRNTGSFSNNVWNKDPKFIDIPKMDFRPDTLSPLRDAGNVQIGKLYPKDLKNTDRTLDAAPDIGAYEFKE